MSFDQDASRVERFGKPVAGSIPTIIRSFKSAATKGINEIRKNPGTKLWQPNYWERVVRNQSELERIRFYIKANPVKWQQKLLEEAKIPATR